MQPKKSVLIITSPRVLHWIDDASNSVSKGLHTFIEALNKSDDRATYAITTADKIDVSIVSGEVRIRDRYIQKDLKEFDLIHFRNVVLFADIARAVALYVEHFGKKVVDVVDTQIPEYGKLSQMVLFALNNIAVPDTWTTYHTVDLAELYRATGRGFPCIMKANNGIKGNDNYLVKSDDELDSIVARHPDMQFLIQVFIPNDSDYRVLYLGTGEPLIFSRVAAEGSHLNNTSRGGTSAEIAVSEFDADALALAERAATATRRIVAGVDVMQNSKTKDWVVLEVNANPALSMGDLLDGKIRNYKKMIGELL